MEELKTLNDLDKINAWETFEGHVEVAELKAEAVKDYKKFSKKVGPNKMEISNVAIYIKWKNNLTEEDLK